MNEIGANDSLRVSIDDAGVVVAAGDVDLAGGPLLEAAILQREDHQAIVIDLSAVEFIDSSGLRSLLGASRRAHERNTEVVLRDPSPEVRRLLEITGTESQFRIEATPSAPGSPT